jgi:hypothetical protein
MPCPQGGDKRSGRIEAHAAVILALIAETVDITLAESPTIWSASMASGLRQV